MKILYKTIGADTQVYVGDCYLLGAEFTHTGTNDLKIYDEADSDKTPAQLVLWLKGGSPTVSVMFPKPGVKCTGIYVDWTAGTGTIYYAIA